MSYTIYDLAKDAGVSVSTVSRVLNNSGPVKENTRKKIISIMKKKKYKPNIFARALNNISLKTIGVVINDIGNPFFAEVVKGIDEECRKNGFNIILCSTGNDVQTEYRELSVLTQKHIEGLIIIGSRPVNDSNRDYLIKLSGQLPIVLINGSIKGGSKIYSVLVDEKKATYEASQYLIDSGYKKIFLLGDPVWKTTQVKLAALKECLGKNRLEFKENQFIDVTYSYSSGRPAVSGILSHKIDKPFAIFCSSDMIAMGVLRELKKLNINVPKDIAVMGYSNTPVSELTTPALSTIDQKMYEMGKLGCIMLINIFGGKYPQKKLNYVESSLVIRETT